MSPAAAALSDLDTAYREIRLARRCSQDGLPEAAAAALALAGLYTERARHLAVSA